jgi:flavin reductase (DIM6/NTAB) family NADH-FMN oxidoreductase RutF
MREIRSSRDERKRWLPLVRGPLGNVALVTVTGDELRSIMRRFPAGIVVVTVVAGGQRLGLTVGSLVSLSLEPALVGISIGTASSLHTPLRDARRFAVSILAGDQERIAQHFARNVPPIALWTEIATRESELPEPLIDGALGWLECSVVGEHPAGDHTFFVAEVRSVELGKGGPALVYVEAEYRPA